MPRIDNDVKLDFKDVLIRPKRSTIKSRNDVIKIIFYSYIFKLNTYLYERLIYYVSTRFCIVKRSIMVCL